MSPSAGRVAAKLAVVDRQEWAVSIRQIGSPPTDAALHPSSASSSILQMLHCERTAAFSLLANKPLQTIGMNLKQIVDMIPLGVIYFDTKWYYFKETQMFKPALTIALFAVTTPTFADQIIALPQDNIAWSTTPEGAEFAALDGDRFIEPYMAMVRLPAGLASPPHVKTANMFGVVMEGTFVHTASDDSTSDNLRLGPGSYYHIPAGLPHVSACVSDVPCVAFLYQDGAFDFNVVKE